MRNVPIFRSAGYTLTELVIVVTIIGLIAAIAVPGVSPGSDKKLDLAAERCAAAIRFARSESMRTGEAHGLTVSQVTQIVTVNKYDLTTSPIDPVSILYHPVSKQPYKFNVSTLPRTEGVTITNADDIFEFKGLGRRRSLVFDARGTPIWVVGSGPTTYLLDNASIELGYGGQQRTVRVDQITGRVTIQ